MISSAAFLTKKLLIEPTELKIYENYFTTYDKEFMARFEVFRSGPAFKFEVRPMECNSLFAELSAPFSNTKDKDFVDYNYLVDDILQISPPYQQGMIYKPTQSEDKRASKDPYGLKASPIPSINLGAQATRNAILTAM